MKIDTAGIIKVAAVITATPRWVAALLAAEGLIIPDSWGPGWLIASALMAAAMAIVEGWAFSYVFAAWRNQSGRKANILIALAAASALVFVGVLTPYVAASVRHVTLGEMMATDWVLVGWSAAVAASTILIVASVGYAQKIDSPAPRPPARSYKCPHCDQVFASGAAKANHVRWSHADMRRISSDVRRKVQTKG